MMQNPNGPVGDSEYANARGSLDKDHTGAPGDDLFGKAPGVGMNDSGNNITAKVDERTSLLPDGAPRGEKVSNSAEGNPSKDEGGNGTFSSDSPNSNTPMTKFQIQLKREETVDRAFISAVKTLTQL